MKLVNVLVLATLLASCEPKGESLEAVPAESTLSASDSVLASAERSSQILDSVTNVTTEKVHSNVTKLTQTIDNYEKQIKSAIKVKTVERVIHDTVYIETKRSFWGKTRTNITQKTDSSTNQVEIIDTLRN